MREHAPTPPEPYTTSDRVAIETRVKKLEDTVKSGVAQLGAEFSDLRSDMARMQQLLIGKTITNSLVGGAGAALGSCAFVLILIVLVAGL